ncbi:MAG: hypothetical protein ACW99A_08485 [Candidatus Kariarchaeaceae archaeon]
MSDTRVIKYITCKSCNNSLLDLDELILMFDYIRSHDANHFKIITITELVDHFEKVCDKFKNDTSHDEAERLVRYSLSNLFEKETEKFSIFDVDRETLDYIHYRIRTGKL